MKCNFLYLALAAILPTSCTHSSMTKTVVTPIDTPVVVVDPDTACRELAPPLHPVLEGYPFRRQYGNGGSACRFNPSNPDEILFYANGSLKKYNMVSRQKTTIINTTIYGRPEWSKKGWIVFNRFDNRIFKIKDNGDSLTLLSPGFATWPIWDKTGTRLAYSSSKYCFLANEDGVISDTFFYPNQFYSASWSPDGKMIATNVAYNGGSGIGYLDLDTRELQKFSAQGSAGVEVADWFPDSKSILWRSEKGIFKTDISNGNTTVIPTIYCKSRSYVDPGISPDGTKIVVCRFDRRAVGDTLISIYGIYMMNADGTNERQIKIPD